VQILNFFFRGSFVYVEPPADLFKRGIACANRNRRKGLAAPDTETKRELPIYYSYEGNVDGIKLLINQSNIGPNMSDRNVHGWGVLHEQVRYARYHDAFLLERLQFWLCRGANVKAKLKGPGHNGFPPGTTPLHVACRGTFDFSGQCRFLLILRLGFLGLFLQNGAELHAVEEFGYTIMRYISVDFPQEELVWWFDLLEFLNADQGQCIRPARGVA
jgi:hypothetical protein